VYANPEFMQGFGLSGTHGVAAFPNGEAQKSEFPVPTPNLARVFVSQTFAFGDELETTADGPNQVAGERAVSRVTVTVGKLAVTDVFLVNAFAGEPRTGFLNWNLYGGGSYDWTMDTLSWTWGALVDVNRRQWALRAGYFLLPVVSNSNSFDTHVLSRGQYVAELELRRFLGPRPGKLQIFGWLNHGNIGSYGDALAESTRAPSSPDVARTRGHERFNGGLVLSAEQTITEHIGMFARASWSPEQVESMGWTDCGESFSAGAVVRGVSWGRPSDTVGLAGVVEGLSPVARRYFAAGGMGIVIGDGKLDYAPEAVLEAYYALSPLSWLTATFDYQLVANPGYNVDRGPVNVFALRVHAAL
jgi:high affinity Mn2+ porin